MVERTGEMKLSSAGLLLLLAAAAMSLFADLGPQASNAAKAKGLGYQLVHAAAK